MCSISTTYFVAGDNLSYNSPHIVSLILPKKKYTLTSLITRDNIYIRKYRHEFSPKARSAEATMYVSTVCTIDCWHRFISCTPNGFVKQLYNCSVHRLTHCFEIFIPLLVC